MSVTNCVTVVPSADLERSLRLWRDGLGFDETWYEERRDGKLVGCGIRKGRIMVLLNIRDGSPEKPENYEGVRFYWAPDDLHALHQRLSRAHSADVPALLSEALTDIDHQIGIQSLYTFDIRMER